MGVTIYSCLFLSYPFKNGCCDANDPHYKYMKNKEYDKFWKFNKNTIQLEDEYRKMEKHRIE